jgi:hypothetical protein
MPPKSTDKEKTRITKSADPIEQRQEQVEKERDEALEEIRARNRYLTDAGLQREANAVTIVRLKRVIARLQERLEEKDDEIARLTVAIAMPVRLV